jgi:hypothetical protein
MPRLDQWFFSSLLFLAAYQRLLVFISGPVFEPLMDTHER